MKPGNGLRVNSAFVMGNANEPFHGPARSGSRWGGVVVVVVVAAAAAAAEAEAAGVRATFSPKPTLSPGSPSLRPTPFPSFLCVSFLTHQVGGIAAYARAATPAAEARRFITFKANMLCLARAGRGAGAATGGYRGTGGGGGGGPEGGSVCGGETGGGSSPRVGNMMDLTQAERSSLGAALTLE